MVIHSPHLLDEILELLLDTIFVVDTAGCFVFVSASCRELLGYTAEELLGRKMVELIHPEDLERTLAAAVLVMEGKALVHFENRYIGKDGRVVDIMWSARWSPKECLRIAVARDVTDLKLAERKQNALYEITEAAYNADNLALLYQHIHRIIAELLPADLFFVVQYDEASGLLEFPYCYGDLSQYPQARSLDPESKLARVIRSGQPLLLSGSDAIIGADADLTGIKNYQEWLGVPLLSPQETIGALVMARRSGGRAYTEKDQDLLQFVSTQIAITVQRKRAEVHLQHIASHDPLTDLANRILFEDRFDMAVKRARREQEKLAILYLDLNGFKQVNDSFGHQAGDFFLCEMARRLSGCVRESDTVARLGGDEFAVLLGNVQGEDSIDITIKKIQMAIECPFQFGGHTLNVSVSIGAAIYPDYGETIKELIHYADNAMYIAKHG